MKEKERINRAIREIIQEVNTFGRFKLRQGSPIYPRALSILEDHHIVIQSRRENSNYWYPGKNFETAIKAGAEKFIWSSREKKLLNYLNAVYYSDKWSFIQGLLIGLLIGVLVTYLLL